MKRTSILWFGAAIASLSLVRAEIVNVALDAQPSANGLTYLRWPMSIIVNGNRNDVIHGDVQLPTGFAYTLDLGQPRTIKYLRIWPRQDGIAPERLSNFRVSVHEDDGAGGIGSELWGRDFFTDGTNPGTSVVEVTLPAPQNARWVQVKCLADPVPDYALQMSELEVFADVPDSELNRALGSAVTANRPLYSGLAAAYLVDGNRYTVVHGAQEVDPGFAYEINLGVSVEFTRLVVFARQDGIAPERLSNYRVSIHPDRGGQPGDPVWQADLHTDGSNPGAEWGSQDVLTADLDPAGQFKGQWIRILSLDDPVPAYALQISEVQAFGIAASAVNLLLTSQPADVVASTGQRVSFSVAAKVVNGDPAQITYQWQREGIDLIGATNATLTIDHVRTQDAGTYRCVVSYPGISPLTSASATLQVRDNYAYGARAWANQPLWGG
ncbi:MAG: discoidin domain-containing protein, partial [Verrucomicrobiia bacterium]